MDKDKDPTTGCEYPCTVDGPEVCDGKDNDCDGLTDASDSDLLYPSSNFCTQVGECGKIPSHGATAWGGSGTYSYPVCTTYPPSTTPDWICNYALNPNVQVVGPNQLIANETWCDNLDNDCDGATDESFTDKGQVCYDSGIGVCKRSGTKQCNSSDKTAGTVCVITSPVVSPGPEVCNGLDDDCDGKTDEVLAGTDKSDDVFVTFDPGGGTIVMFAYEATRPDAGSTSQGAALGPRPCSRAGRLPWSNITKEDAAAACAAVGSGWRLCSGTEWYAACKNGGTNNVFPYGNTYDVSKCNGADYASLASPDPRDTIPGGEASSCKTSSPVGLLDMSGNVREWVTAATSTGYELRGGAYDTLSYVIGGVRVAPGLQCDAAIAAPTVAVRLPSVGFRCCHTGALP